MSQKFSWVARFSGVFAAVGMIAAAGVAYAAIPALSQTNVTVGIGQSVPITSTNGVSVYLYSNPNSVVASVSPNGTQITVTGGAVGSDTVSLCAVGTASDCTSLNITVQQTVAASGISFNQNNLSLAVGTNQQVTVSGGSGTYTISNNSNTGVASTGLSGTVITVSGVAAGAANISVCDTSNTNTCGTLSVTVTSSNSSSTAGLSFSQSNISLTSGGSQVATISGGNGTYNIINNSNPSAVSVGMSSAGITVYATASGSGTVKVCDTAGVCGTLNVTISGASTANQAVTFSVPNPTLTVGQSLNVQLSGSNAPSYIVFWNESTNIVQASVTGGSTLVLSGVSAGTDSVTVCATGGGCAPLSVTVTGATNTTAPAVTTTPPPTQMTTIAPPVLPTTPVTLPASVVANTTLLAEVQALQAAVTQTLAQIQSIQTQLNQLVAQVNAGSGAGIGTSATPSVAQNGPSGASYDFTELLTVGSQDAQVAALQNRLIALGFLSGPATGYFGAQTQQAVMKYQTAHGITATGYTGPSTRAALNAGN